MGIGIRSNEVKETMHTLLNYLSRNDGRVFDDKFMTDIIYNVPGVQTAKTSYGSYLITCVILNRQIGLNCLKTLLKFDYEDVAECNRFSYSKLLNFVREAYGEDFVQEGIYVPGITSR